jgi:hypothetical protein
LGTVQRFGKNGNKLKSDLRQFSTELRSSRLLSKNVGITIYKTIIFPVILHGYETWSLSLRKEHRPRVFENRVLRRIFVWTKKKLIDMRLEGSAF